MNTAPLPTAVHRFLADATVPGDMALPFHYPRPEEWESWQSGFRRHGNTGESLLATTPGAWQPGWYVIALNGFDDPFFIDLQEAAQGYPVYYALHGAGRWEAQCAAPNLQRFGEMLATLRDYGDDDAAALRWMKAEVDLDTELWREVWEERQKRKPLDEEPPCTTPPDPTAWQHGALVITAIGPQKMKIVHWLKQALDLTPQQALALAAQPSIEVGSGYRTQWRGAEEQLQALGATVEFRADGPCLKVFQRNTSMRIEELIDCVKARQERAESYAVYSATGEAFNVHDEVFIADTVQVNAQGQEVYPAMVRERGLHVAYAGDQFQDVVDLALRQQPGATHADIIRALNHYSMHDDFLDL